MDIKQLKSFVAIVDFGSLTKAAGQLNVAQPALSLQLANLEAECHARLVDRSNKGVTPTEVGKILYHHARLVLRQMEETREAVQRGAGFPSGVVTVGLPTTVTAPIAAPLVKAVRERYPGIRIQILETLSGYLSELLANYRLDWAVLFRDVETRGIKAFPFATEELYLIGDRHLNDMVPKSRACRLAELSALPLLLPGKTHNLRLTVERAFSASGIDPNIVADIDSPRTAVLLAEQGVGYTILPLSGLLHMSVLERNSICYRRITAPIIKRKMSLCCLAEVSQSTAVSAVGTLILDTIREVIEDGRWQGVQPIPQ